MPPALAEPDWLALRRTADERARDAGAAALLDLLVQALEDSLTVPGKGLLQVIDVGAGTGANGHYLRPRLPWPQQWVVVDHDPAHLRHPAHDGAVAFQAGIGELPGALAGLAVPTGAVRLVTCAALLDVLTEQELSALARLVLDSGGPALLSLSVDGRVILSPEDPVDDTVARAFDRHQQRHGRLGPAAGARMARLLERLGSGTPLTLRSARTDWCLGPDTPELLGRWLEERVAAALEQEPHLAPDLTAWLERRRAQLRDGRLLARVGHTDLLVLPGSQGR